MGNNIFVFVLLSVISFHKLVGQYVYSVSYPSLNTIVPSGNGEQKSVQVYLYISGKANTAYKLYYSGSKDTFIGKLSSKGCDTITIDSATKMTSFVYVKPNIPASFTNYLPNRVLCFNSAAPANVQGFLEYQTEPWDGGKNSLKSRVQQLELSGYANCNNNFSPNYHGSVFPCFAGNALTLKFKKHTFLSVNSYTPILFKNYPWWFYGSRQILQVICNSDSAIVEITGSVDLLNGQAKGKPDTQIIKKGQMLYLGADKGNMSGTQVRTLNCSDVRVYSGAYHSPREMLWEKQYNKPDSPYTESDAMLQAIYYSEIRPSTEYGYRYLIPQYKVMGDTLAWWYMNMAKDLGQPKWGLDGIKPGYSSVQVMALQNNTKVKINGRNRTLKNKGDFFGDSVQWVGYIESDKPVNAVWYCAPMCGHGSYMLPALDIDRISKDTQSLPCFWGYNSKIRRPWKGPVAYVFAPGSGKPEVWINGRKKKLEQRCPWMGEQWYFDTIVLLHNFNNRIHSKNGCMGVYSFEFYGLNSQRAFVFGTDAETPQLRLRINGQWNMSPLEPMRLCQNTAAKLEAVTAWYTPKTVQWLLPGGKTDTGSTINFIFRDTGLQTITIISESPAADCDIQRHYDTLHGKVYVYSIPKFSLGTDTTLCQGTAITLYSSRSELPRPVWREKDSLLCQSCDSLKIQATRTRTITGSVSKVGCAVQRDTIVVRTLDSLQIKIDLPQGFEYCFGQVVQAKLLINNTTNIEGLYHVNWNLAGGSDTGLLTQADSSKWLRVKVADRCGTIYKDSAYIKVYAPLSLFLNTDTTLCYNSKYKPQFAVFGGYLDSIYTLSWNGKPGIPDFEAQRDTQILAILTDGCSVADTQRIVIKVHPKLEIALKTLPDTWCYRQSLPIKATAMGGDTNQYAWSLYSSLAKLDTTTGPAFATIQSSKNAGYYTLKLYNRCGSADTTVKSQWRKYIHISLQQGDTLCPGMADTLQGDLGASGTLYAKRGGFVDSLETADGKFKIAVPSGSSAIELIATDGCSIPDTLSMNPPKASVLRLLLPDSVQACSGSVLQIPMLSQGGIQSMASYATRYKGLVETGSQPTFNATASGYATVTVTDGCTQVTDSVYVQSIGSSQAALFADTTGCTVLQTQVVLPAQSTVGAYWNIDAGDGRVVQQKPAQLGVADTVFTLYPMSGNYIQEVKLQVGNLLCPLGNAKITVYASPKADFIFIPEAVDVSLPDVIVRNQSTGANQYQWQLPDGSLRSGSEFGWKFTDSGQYGFVLIAKNAQGCSDTQKKEITVYGKLVVYMPTAFRPAGVNNSFMPVVVNGRLKVYRLYNRWGEKLYEGMEPYQPRDGSSEQMLICIVIAESPTGKEVKVKGTVVVLR